MTEAEQKALRTMAAAIVIRQVIAAVIFALLAIFVHPAWAIAVILSFCL